MKKQFAIVLLAIVFMGASAGAYGTTVTVNDNTVGTGTNQFNYHGSGWSYGSQSGAYDNDNHWDYTTNDYYTFQFNGQQAVVYGSMNTDGGIAAYSVDGGAETNFDDYAATRVDNVFLFATPILSSGIHTLKVRVTGLKNPASTYYTLPADRIDVNSGLTAVTVNDNALGTGSDQFNYQGSGWFYGSQSGAYDSDNHWDYTTNDYYTFQFNGTEAIVYGSIAPNGGIAAYSVDGGAETNFDDYAATRVDDVFLFATPILSSGTHILKVRVTGLKNPASSYIVLAADRIDVSTTSGGGTVATPTFSPGAGTYTSAQTVTISDSTSGATIHYTTNGSTPTASSTTYTAPISVSTSETVKAIGVETGWTNSAVGSAAYTISLTVATPIFSPRAGTYTSAQTVTISDATSGATIHYTTDGSTPTTSSTTYSSPISVSTSETVEAIGVLSGYTNSAVGSAAYTISSGSGHTWYVDPAIGGTRYSTNVTDGLCDGTVDAAPVGTTPNQHCAFNDVRNFWTDGTYTTSTSDFPAWGWIGSGGDTYIIVGCASGNTSGCRIGQSGPNSGDWYGLAGNPFGAGAPPPLSGTSGAHTRILGSNFASCSSSSAKAYLNGGYGVFPILDFSGATYVDFQCIDLTDHAQCSRVGSTPYPSGCSTSFPLDDFATAGIRTTNTTANVLIQDVNIHGVTNYGLIGPIGGLITMTRVNVNFNGFAGWDFDDGLATPDAPGSNIVASYVTMEGNGCNEEYPIVHSFPAISCYDDNSGGFGDAWSAQGSGSGGQLSQLSMSCSHCTLAYNTKDGFGMNHITFDALSITDSIAYGNMGQQWKWSAFDNSTNVFTNNLVVGNCSRLSQPIPGSPYSYGYSSGSGPGAYLTDFCRASGDNVAIGVGNGGTTLVAFNTITGYAATTFDLTCLSVSDPTCAAATITFKDNILLGYSDPGYNDGQAPGAYYTGALAKATLARSYNDYFNQRDDGCPTTGFTGEICIDPLLVSEPASPIGEENQLDNFNFNLTSGSPAIATGITISGITTDYNGTTRPNPPSIGACETTATCP